MIFSHQHQKKISTVRVFWYSSGWPPLKRSWFKHDAKNIPQSTNKSFFFFFCIAYTLHRATGTYDDVMGVLTRLLARGAGSGVLGEVDSFGVSEVELRDELLLESSLFCLFVPNGKRKATKSETSFCSSL